ncbi:hypothetical protein Pmani_007854 [Petrolisthes manimaculis]|uniref:Uncharacterized protein n=1 Tax=Petrolisthes manimaculis TaxID=1843537 RepID=A0AAE1UKB3_9EUCA|nr:hypothetical protein Pmani_007854 [Petrolisthes manimaculis]
MKGASTGGGGDLEDLLRSYFNKDDDGHSKEANRTKNEHDLFNVLFKTYNKHVRPISVAGAITKVFFELSLFNILIVDTKRQAITTNSEIIMKWQDDYLFWDPKEYGGINRVRVPYYDIWSPDIILQNTAAPNYEGGIINTNAIISYNGEVELTSHAVLDSICIMDVQWYPFDQQTCNLVFASWTFDVKQIKLLKGPADLSKYSQNPEFFLEDFYMELTEVHNPCCEDLISTLMVFSLPAESGEKVGLGINSMLAMMVFLMAMTENLPPTEKLPLAGVYYGACITMITLNITLSVTVLNLNVMGMRGYQVPMLIRNGTLFVARVILVRIPRLVRESWNIGEDNHIIEPEDPDEIPDDVVDVDGSVIRVFTVQPQKIQPDITTEPKKSKVEDVVNSLNEAIDYGDLKDPFQRRAVRALEAISGILTREEISTDKSETKRTLVEEWKFVSRVMDRTLFLIFTSSAVIFNITLLTSSPFRESFNYCPLDNVEECEDLTSEEIFSLTAHAAASAHFDGGHDEGGGGGGGHDAPPSSHLKEDSNTLFSTHHQTNENSQGGQPEEEIYEAIPGPLYKGFEGLGLLIPGSPEALRLQAERDPFVALPGPAYEGTEGHGLLVPGSPEAERLLGGHDPLVTLQQSTRLHDNNNNPSKETHKHTPKEDEEQETRKENEEEKQTQEVKEKTDTQQKEEKREARKEEAQNETRKEESKERQAADPA